MTRRIRTQILWALTVLFALMPAVTFAADAEPQGTSAAPPLMAPSVSRGAALPALYVSLAAMQVADIYSTRAALKAGAREANPVVAPFAGSSGSMLAVKAASTAGAIFFADRLARNNRKAAIVLMAVINGATAAVAAHNMKNVQKMRR